MNSKSGNNGTQIGQWIQIWACNPKLVNLISWVDPNLT